MSDDHQHSAGVDASEEEANRSHEFMRRRHKTMLAVACGIVVLAVLFRVRADQRIEFRVLPDYPLPESCISRSMLGFRCPGCGLTRSFVHLAHGDWRSSLAIHRIGWVMVAAVLLQFPYRIYALSAGRDFPLGTRFPAICGWVIIVLLFGNWVARAIW